MGVLYFKMKNIDKALDCIDGCQQYHDEIGKCSGKNCVICRRYDTISEQLKFLKDELKEKDDY